jgi:ppGpp synthetase/RelA/SpoT-type nucleotidyltranferase
MSEEDLLLLDQYRRSFEKPYDRVLHRIRRELQVDPTGRPAKSTTSVRDKLRRESIRLSQMQDIAGCRIVVADRQEQERVASALREHFPDSIVFDRRESPSHGYRAVHIVVTELQQPVEIQLRTRLEHNWAELSELLSDAIDPAIKYGAGPPQLRRQLNRLSQSFFDFETAEHERRKVFEALTHAPKSEWRALLRRSELLGRKMRRVSDRVPKESRSLLKWLR